MATIKIGTRVCNNCVHWLCDKGRASYDERICKNTDVCTPANRAECDLSRSWKDATDTCPCFEHIPDKRSPGEAFARALGVDVYTGRRLDGSRLGSVAETEPEPAHRHVCSRCGGTGRVRCPKCAGRGTIDCLKCSGNGGFKTILEIKELRKCLKRRVARLVGTLTDDAFWNEGWNWKTDPDAVEKYEVRHDVCSKTKELQASVKRLKIQDEVLNVSWADGDFHLPDGLTDDEKGKRVESHLETFNTYIEKCKEIEKEAQSWSSDGWDATHRIKSASLKITETPCFVQVEFKDRYGFNRTALVNLASKKVYLNEVSEEERKRRMPELEAEAANDADLQNVIGQMYGNYPKFKGYAPKDEELAAEWFMRAAKAGHADAMDNLGNSYKNGDGVEKDEELAAAWYAKAAMNGLPWGQFHYADVLEDGKGVPKDDELAVAWYLKAAKQGLANAQWRLGCRIADGRGTAKDEELGEAWKERAKANGFVPPRSSGW